MRLEGARELDERKGRDGGRLEEIGALRLGEGLEALAVVGERDGVHKPVQRRQSGRGDFGGEPVAGALLLGVADEDRPVREQGFEGFFPRLGTDGEDDARALLLQ